MPPPPTAEVLNPAARRGRFAAAVFDFDGTLSLVREGWAGIMADLGLDLFRERNLPARDGDRERLEKLVLRQAGKPSIFQMRELADEVAARGGDRPDPDVLLAEFLRRLFAVADERKSALASGSAPPAAWAVSGSHAVLADLRRRGVALYLASGTDLKHVRREAELLQLTEFFGEHVYAPVDDTPNFSKGDVVAMILRTHGIPGDRLIGFGDGASETVEVKRVGGLTVGVASREAGVPGVNAMKRTILADLGADVIVPDYAEHQTLLPWLFAED